MSDPYYGLYKFYTIFIMSSIKEEVCFSALVKSLMITHERGGDVMKRCVSLSSKECHLSDLLLFTFDSIHHTSICDRLKKPFYSTHFIFKVLCIYTFIEAAFSTPGVNNM